MRQFCRVRGVFVTHAAKMVRYEDSTHPTGLEDGQMIGVQHDHDLTSQHASWDA